MSMELHGAQAFLSLEEPEGGRCAEEHLGGDAAAVQARAAPVFVFDDGDLFAAGRQFFRRRGPAGPPPMMIRRSAWVASFCVCRGRGKKCFRAERPPRRRPCALKGRFQPVFTLSRFPIPLPKLSERGMGQLGRKCLKSSSCQKIQNVRMAYAACEPSRTFPARQSLVRKRSGKGEGPLRFLPSPVCLLRYVGLEQEFAGGGTYLSIMGSATGSSPCIPCGISGVTAAMA